MWTGGVTEYLKHLSTCRAFRHILAQGPRKLLDMQDGDKVERDESIWTTSDVNAYHEASENGNMHLTLLPNSRLVSINMTQNPDPDYAPQRLLPNKGIMRDCKPNVRVSDAFDTSTILVLLPQDDGFFNITHHSEQ